MSGFTQGEDRFQATLFPERLETCVFPLFLLLVQFSVESAGHVEHIHFATHSIELTTVSG